MPNQNKTSAKNDSPIGQSGGQGTSARTARETGASSDLSTAISDPEGALEKAKDTAKTLLDGAKNTASSAYGAVADQATSTIEAQKAGLTGGLTTAAETVRRVSGTISEGGDQNGVIESAARYTETAAQKLENAAHYFESTDFRGIARDVESFARRNPAIFLGAAFALGVLAARFIKSGPMTLPDNFATGDAGNTASTDTGNRQDRGFEARSGVV